MSEIEHPRVRMARHFGLGKYGDQLAHNILGDYVELLATDLEELGAHMAADDIREFWRNESF